jgi:V/A-type H+-transporting ATPase subunit I
MSIVPLKKVTLCGLSSETHTLLQGLQELGCMHLIALRPQTKEPEKAPPERAEDAYKALRYLKDTKKIRRQVMEPLNFDFDDVVAKTLHNQRRRREVEDRRDFLKQRIKQLTPWGEFDFPKPQELNGYLFWFYRVPHNLFGNIKTQHPFVTVYKDTRFTYVVVVSREEPAPSDMPVVRTRAGAVPLNHLRHHLEQAEIELEDIDAEHCALTRWIYQLSANLAHAEDRAALTHASCQVLQRDKVCALQGWVPETRLEKVKAFADKHKLALLEEHPGEEDVPPTLMQNPPAVSGGEDLVGFYQTPAYRAWDPSAIVFFSFALFFAMILADAGYALVLGVVVAYFWRRLGKKEKGRRFRLMAVAVLGASLVYGILTGSYFGVSPPPGSPLSYVNVLDLNHFDAMMLISIVIGCLHLALANGLVAYQARTWPARLQPIGWLGVIFGGLLLWFHSQAIGPQWSKPLAVVFLSAGLALILLFASERRVTSLKTGALRLFDGVTALTNITKMFGDVLSYLRLFALGLASSSLAITFNQLASQVEQNVSGLGLLLAILILLLGHTINLALGIISGFVHGLRLNFIEFFNWGMSDEGYPFKAFAKKEIET